MWYGTASTAGEIVDGSFTRDLGEPPAVPAPKSDTIRSYGVGCFVIAFEFLVAQGTKPSF